jgi:hypothetical protein
VESGFPAITEALLDHDHFSHDAVHTERGNTIMNITHNTKTFRLIAALGVAAAAAVAPVLVFAGAGTAHLTHNS